MDGQNPSLGQHLTEISRVLGLQRRISLGHGIRTHTIHTAGMWPRPVQCFAVASSRLPVFLVPINRAAAHFRGHFTSVSGLHSPTAQTQGIRTQAAHTARVHATTVPNFSSIRHRVAILQVKNRPTGVRNLLKVRTRKGTTFQPQLACEVHFHFLSVSAVWSQPAGP